MAEDNIEIPQGLAYPWIFVRKKDIFETLFALESAFKQYRRIYAQDKGSRSKYLKCMILLIELYGKIKMTAKKNKEITIQYASTLEYLDKISTEIKDDFNEDDFPELWEHYLKLTTEILDIIGLTNIEKPHEDPGKALETTGG